jgi:hypothetical protein
MEELILSLSKEPTDESRRARVVAVFAEALAKPNGAPVRSSQLFDQTVIAVGDRVRSLALEKALLNNSAASASCSCGSLKKNDMNADDSASTSTSGSMDSSQAGPMPASGDYMSGRTSDDEKQVWALVDMMIQSKTIVKKASGELGSSGNFA